MAGELEEYYSTYAIQSTFKRLRQSAYLMMKDRPVEAGNSASSVLVAREECMVCKRSSWLSTRLGNPARECGSTALITPIVCCPHDKHTTRPETANPNMGTNGCQSSCCLHIYWQRCVYSWNRSVVHCAMTGGLIACCLVKPLDEDPSSLTGYRIVDTNASGNCLTPN